ncbi:unnamed protein product [Paramecium primaurelia]|uniref:Nudix hydrolase domain-containing protein n=1 Tax=Paramecium primaurelia TaxID=5886 RepID=A0A8S1Q0T5_PARPR|nr:unnamed protein product [Paramecium primaurelia]
MISQPEKEQNAEDKEIIIIVNEKNEIIGQSKRKEMRQQKLIHRATYIFVLQTKTNKLFIHKRSQEKRYCPGYFDACFGGVVAINETYESNATKEIHEEIGLQNVNIIPKNEFYYEDQISKIWGKIFFLYFDGEANQLTPQIEEVEYIDLKEIKDILVSNDKWTPDGMHALKLFIEQMPELKQYQ